MNKNDKGSSDRFGYEWDKYDGITPDYEEQFLKWVRPLKSKDFSKKTVLDAGCGIGRNSYWPLRYGAKQIVAFDYDERTVESAKKNLKEFKNAKVGFGNIYEIPYENEFDIVFSIGVIHHLEHPEKAISQMIKAAKRGGKVLMWVYGYESNEWVVRYINPIRKITSKLPVFMTHYLTYLFSVPLYFYVKVFPQKHKYFRQISKFKFWHVHSIIFDQLIPKIANYWKKEEVLNLFKNKGLKDINIEHVNSLSWTIMGTKE